MKLTNLSLSILVALGLIACGGSDDNSNAAADNNNAGHQQGGKGGSGGVPQEEKKPEQTNNDDKKDDQKSGLDPERKTPDLKVPADLVDIVNSRKKSVIVRGFSDNALGYDDANGEKYNDDANTNPGDIKHLSMYKYKSEKDLIAEGGSKGAIDLGQTPTNTSTNLNAWAKGADNKFYRVKLKDATPYTKNSEFQIVETGQNGFGAGSNSIKQKDIYFIANASDNPSVKVIDLKNTATGYDLKKSQVVLNTVSVMDTQYLASTTGQELDLSKLPVKKEIQVLPITGVYTIVNGKDTAKSIDDKILTKNINLGYLKAYNLPFSAAYVTTDSAKEHNKKIFSDESAFNVVGYETTAQPKDGRAFYTGKSFSTTVEGDVDLVADFFADRAGISGVVKNRKNIVTDEGLPDLVLGRASLVNNYGVHQTSWGKTDVTGDGDYADKWSGALYGLDAQEATGRIWKGNDVVEVFGTQRKVLTNKSNDASTN